MSRDVHAAAFESLLWLGGLLVVLLLASVILVWVRRRSRAARQSVGSGFTLESIRRLRDRGDVSPTEYEALKKKLVEEAIGRGSDGKKPS